MNRADLNKYMAVVAATGQEAGEVLDAHARVLSEVAADSPGDEQTDQQVGLTAEDRAEVARAVAGARLGRSRLLDPEDDVARVVAAARRIGGPVWVHRG